MSVLAIGASVIDIFLSVDPKFAKTRDGNIAFRLGDKIPSDLKTFALGGNGANVSVGLTRLEIPTSFYTYLGGDVLSREIQEGLTREGVELLAPRSLLASASFSIILGFDRDRIIFSHHEVSDYSFVCEKTEFDFIYLTSIGQHWEKAYEQILDFAKKNKIKIAFSPGIHQLENINETVREIIKDSTIYFSNREEAETVLGKAQGIDIKELLAEISNLGPKIVSITDGTNGAYAADAAGNFFYIKPSPSRGHEKTGAGDAYASALFATYLHGESIPVAMLAGTLNAGAVIQKAGAQKGLLTRSTLEEQIRDASFAAEQI